ncbi:hypothetical protein GOP47_0018928 [Adiantum capillus-veneris]|uniref:Nuclear pore complex protein NUP160 n=1 Tax=Adiantum capillus-veneris TaxID=13818 RepID=A0A9D4UE47_ADICA|nr:hypothetical protein GOP47_0018928 [Adiantum capillus-veneris]
MKERAMKTNFKQWKDLAGPLDPQIKVTVPKVHVTREEGIIFVYAVTVSGVLYILRIRAFYKYRSISTIASSDIVQLSLVSELGRLDQITALSGAGDSVCVGGRSGSILCYFLRNFNVETKEHYVELKDSDAILGRLWGLVARPKITGSVRSLKVQTYKARTLLFALHEDGVFKLWDLHNQSRLLNSNLYKGDSSGFIPKMMWVQEPDIGRKTTKVAILFQKEEAKIQNVIHIYDLQLDQVDGAGGQAALNFQLQTRAIEGIVLDLKLLSDRFWKLDMEGGQFHLNCYSTKREELIESCELLDAELQDQLFQWPGDDWEELILFLESLNTGSKTELQLPISSMFISRLLQSGVYQQHSLCKVLQKYKRSISETDFGLLTREGLQREVLAVINTENVENDKMERLMHWRDLCREYFSLWKLSNVPYSLMFDYQTESIGLIRQQCVSFRRPLSNFEKVYKGCSDPEFLDFLFKCTSTIKRQVGRVPYAVFGDLLFGNRHISVSHLCSVFLHFLDVGYTHFTMDNQATHIGADVERKKALDYRHRHRKLELQLIVDLQHLRNFAGGWSHVLDCIEGYIVQVTQETRIFPEEGNSEALNGFISKRLVLKSTAQLSWNLFEAAKDLLILLSYLIHIKGQVGISNNETSRIQKGLIMKVKNILLRGLLVHWLSTNFAEVAPPEDFSLHLSTLHLDNVSANKHDRQYGMQEMTLAEILLSSCLKIFPKGQISNSKGILSSDYLLDATKFLTSWLMWGKENDQRESLSSHSVTLAAVLLQHGQYRALQELLGIVENFCNELEVLESKVSKGDWCARLHLLGCGLLGQSRNGLKESAIKSRVEKAVHHFFRVASVVGQGREAALSLFSQIGMDTSYLVHGVISSWKFHYYEWVMQIFEQNHELEGACQFAYAALQEADEAARHSIVEDTTEISTAVLAIKGCLWANIFKFSLDKRKYKEAYCAIMSNPDKESKYVCLRRFLIVLCEQKAAEVLCGSKLPYAGMLERLEQELFMKAQHSDLNANPNPFKLLYSFHMQRSKWRRAALYMYAYSVRMKEMGLAEAGLPVQFVLQEQLSGLAAAINALHLVEPMHAWLDLESISSGSIVSGQPSSKRMRVYANSDAGYAMHRKRTSYVDIQELEKEYTLTLAKILLVEADVRPNIHGDDLSPENLVLLLVQTEFYEMAFTVLFQFWKDSSLKSELERIFKIMAERWCVRQQDNIMEKPLSSNKLLLGSERTVLLPSMSDEDTSPEREKSIVAVATKDVTTTTTNNWLQVYLEKYTKLHPHLLVVVAETLLSIDRLIELPYWLVDMLKGGQKAGGEGMATTGANPSALLRIYLDFGRVTEAAMLFLEYVKARSNLVRSEFCSINIICCFD